MSKEALKLALEALEQRYPFTVSIPKAITAIKEALSSEAMKAQSEQEQRYGHKGKCNRIMPDGKLCQLNAPCPDCGMSLIDYPKPEQEPVAIVSISEARDLAERLRMECANKQNWDYVRWTAMMRVAADMLNNACNATPPQRNPLPFNEYYRLWLNGSIAISFDDFTAVVKLTEAAHGIKE